MFQVRTGNDPPFTPHYQAMKHLFEKTDKDPEEYVGCVFWFEDDVEIFSYDKKTSQQGICNYDTLVDFKVMCRRCPLYINKQGEIERVHNEALAHQTNGGE